MSFGRGPEFYGLPYSVQMSIRRMENDVARQRDAHVADFERGKRKGWDEALDAAAKAMTEYCRDRNEARKEASFTAAVSQILARKSKEKP